MFKFNKGNKQKNLEATNGNSNGNISKHSPEPNNDNEHLRSQKSQRSKGLGRSSLGHKGDQTPRRKSKTSMQRRSFSDKQQLNKLLQSQDEDDEIQAKKQSVEQQLTDIDNKDRLLAIMKAQKNIKMKQRIEISKKGSRPPDLLLHAGTIVGSFLAIIVILQLLFAMRFFRFRIHSFIRYFVYMGIAGLGVSYMYWGHRRYRKENSQKINLDLNSRAFLSYFEKIPTWIKLSDKEKVKWLNTILLQFWPYYDKAICDQITEQVSPMLDDFAFPPVRKFRIEKLRFGDAPVRFENVRMVDEGPQAIAFEMDIRWRGDTKIILGIESYGLGSTNPSITNITFVGTIKIFLKPLVPAMPGIGAIIATFRRPPLFKYSLNFGALGGKAIAQAVQPVIDNVIREQLSNMLVWPNRYIVPICSEEVTGSLEPLKQNTQGVLKVTLVKAIDLYPMDMGGTTDAYVEFYTQIENIQKSKVIKKNLNPVFNETKYVLVQEPTDQCLRIIVYDIDPLNMSKLYKNGFNVVKGFVQSFNAKTEVGKQLVDLKNVCSRVGVPQEGFYQLGRLDWSSPDGCGSGRGQVHLKMEYSRIGDINPLFSKKGALVVHIKRGFNIQGTTGAFGVNINMPSPYVKVKCHQKELKTAPVSNNANPVWDKKLTWFEIDIVDMVNLSVMDECGVVDEEIGIWETDIGAIIECKQQVEGKMLRGIVEKQVEVGDGPAEGTIDLKLQYIPYY